MEDAAANGASTIGIWIPLLAVILGVLIGGVVQAAVGRYAAFRESQGIKAALKAEIAEIINLIERRKYLELGAEIITRLEDTSREPDYKDIFTFRVTQDYFVVFHSVCPKIGQINKHSSKVVRFYTLLKAILEDLNTLGGIVAPAASGTIPLERAELLFVTKEMESLARNALDTGKELLREL